MNKPTLKYLMLGLLLVGFTAPAAAEVLLIDEVIASKSMDLPDNGLSMQAVESRWGAPQQRSAAVGEPPITRWEYSDYSVYFEHNVVITSVLNSGAVIQ